ncbi:kelch-like protein 3 isoform X2 [Strongylocentrotus purpuratus]|uniref:BTB domain-containing protein n=1 Tax=Strongylocentrotus purpuratus TaxID=7668 RepID=A0A7M7NIA4_STRPU|nr:kelch-like protein 3 isoform X2 [Strongylocentrotus purpuratus]XP_030835352.1 kelch-like protein 3 isoform X2 [Strongylocentrotus purpuratus]|eukprot:XP_011677556.1 PREDICTED: kelch-like protein 3 isoform X2 [Strongylocentrotus purpuratus]
MDLPEAIEMEDMEIPPPDAPPYTNNLHTQKAFEVLNVFRKQNILCDVILEAEGVEIPAHRIVLASCSQYFSAMFTSELSESRAEKIILQEVDGRALSLLIDFVYTSEVQVTEENVQTLLPAASLLQLNDVRDACCDFLQKQLHPTNCLGIRAFADVHSCSELYHYGQNYTMQHFSAVVHSDEFFALPAAQVCELISSDHLTVHSEEEVFEAVVSWVKQDPSNRSDYMPQLVEHVRLPLLSRDYLIQRVEEEQLIKGNSDCKDFLIEAMKYHLLPKEQRGTMKNPRTRLRTPIGLPKLMLVVGGQAPKAIRSVEVYDFKEETWTQAAEMPSRRCRAGVAVLNGMVYAVGGFNGSLRVRTVDVYDPVRNMWSSVASMEARRSTLGVAVLNGMIYAVGGFDGTTGLSSVEAYDPKMNEWRPVAQMNTRRSSVGVAVLNGFLYAVGGYDGASRHCLSSVERYDPADNKWSTVAEMSTRRSGAGVGVVDGLLYAVGGHDGPMVRKSVEVYNPDSDRWSQVADMTLCRRNAGVASVNGLLYVVGGDDGTSNLASVECFNPRTDNWSLVRTTMTTGRSYSGIATIDKVPSLNAYREANSLQWDPESMKTEGAYAQLPNP